LVFFFKELKCLEY